MIHTHITQSEIVSFITKMQRLEGDIPADSFLGRLASALKSANMGAVKTIQIEVVNDISSYNSIDSNVLERLKAKALGELLTKKT
jgi:hypothetical protein